MADPTQFSTRSASVRRLMQEARELSSPTEMFHAQPIQDNLFEWHFTVRGPEDSDFAGGIYHGRILFPPDYPMKPPNLILLTPNGRFELSKKICLSISGYHPETWLPSWSVRTALLALIGFMPSAGAGAIGSLSYPPEERRKLAKLSVNWRCKECGAYMKEALQAFVSGSEIGAEAECLTRSSQPSESTPSSVAKEDSRTREDDPSASGNQQNLQEEEADPERIEAVTEPLQEPRINHPRDTVPQTSQSEISRALQRASSSGPDYIAILVYFPLLFFLVAIFCSLAYRRYVLNVLPASRESSEL